MNCQSAVLTEHSLFSYFQPFVHEAMEREAPSAGEHAEYYLVKLLSEFGQTGRLYQGVGQQDPALAIQLTSALNATKPGERAGVLKRVGDHTLFMTGFFSGGLNTKMVNLDYYINLGTSAYHQLADQRLPGDISLKGLFEELAMGFERFVEVLRWVADRSRPPTDTDLHALYQAWWTRGCNISAKRLKRLGYKVPRRSKVD